MVTESEPDTAPAETTEKELEFTPDEWVYIEDSLSVLIQFYSVTNADCSKGSMRDIIEALVKKMCLLL